MVKLSWLKVLCSQSLFGQRFHSLIPSTRASWQIHRNDTRCMRREGDMCGAPAGNCCPGFLLRSHPGVSHLHSHPAALPAGRKVLSSSCQQKAIGKGVMSLQVTEIKIVHEIPSHVCRLLHAFQLFWLNFLETSLASWLIGFRAMYYSVSTREMNQNNLRLIHLSQQS